MKGNIVIFRQGIYCENISSRFWEIYHLIECHISIWPDSPYCFLLSLFLWTPGWQTSAANWLTRFMWKEILSTLPRESIMTKFRAVWRNITSKIVMSWKLLPKCRQITWFFLSMFLWTPGWQTSAANWLTRFMCKEILFTLRRESIMKKFRAVLEKCNI